MFARLAPNRRSCSIAVALLCLLAACGDDDAPSDSSAAGSGGRGGAGSGSQAGRGGSDSKPSDYDPPSAAHTVAGVVTDIAKGTRVAGASVNVVGSDRSATTDASGQFSLSDVPEGDVSLSISKAGYAPGYATARSDDGAQAALVSLKKLGSMQSYDPSRAATLSETTDDGPYAVIFTADSLDTTDTQLKVTVTPLDPTSEDAALPGDLIAGGQSPNALEAVTFAEFGIIDSQGKRVNLKPSASAIVELPIPIGLRADYPLDSKIHCYAYNPTTGKWEDFVEGTVALSSVDKVTPVLRASIRHFSWYGGAPEIQDQECVVVQVFSKLTGKPLEGATISARPGLKAVSNADGVASITVKKGVKVKYTATKTYTDTYVDDQGNLIPQKGSKVIDFGRVEQDDELVSLIQGPCPSSGGPSDKSKPIKIETGPLPEGAFVYEVTAVISEGSTSVIIEKGIPDEEGEIDEPEPVDGANVVLRVAGSKDIALVSLSAMLPPEVMVPATGLYTTANGAAVSADGGESYTLTIDVDGNGSVDATGSCEVPGELAWVTPKAGAEYDAQSFSAAWTDSASGDPGYSVEYYAIFIAENDESLGAVYTGTERSFMPDPPLAPGQYRATLQTAYNSSTFSGVSVQGQLICGASAGPEVSFTIK